MWPFNRTTVTNDNGALDSRPDSPAKLAKSIPSSKKQSDSAEDGMPTMGQTWNALLEPFKGQQVPQGARTDPTVIQREEEPMTLAKLWQYVPFLAVQGTSLTKAFVNHHLYGPPKPSWGVELTLFTSFLREVAAYSHLSSLTKLRSLLELGSLLPAPKDGIITPISFRVKKRGLRGFLAEADAAEDGKRHITGEWVINKRLWRRMQAEFALKKTVPQDGRVILYLHGGAYYVMSTETHRFLTISVSRYAESRVFAINYRLAPETRFPGQLHDAVSAYMRLIVDLKIPPENIIFAGDSAGAGLAVATMMYLRDEGYPLPSGAFLMSPWVDLTMSCESWTTNREFDYLPSPKQDDPFNPVQCLLGPEGIKKYLTHPYVSPLFGDLTGLPPLLIQAGDAEVLRDEITLLAHKASLAGVSVEHEIFEDCVHVFQAFLFLEASRKALQSIRHFVKYKLPHLNKPKDVNFAEIDADIAADAHQVSETGVADPTSLPSSPRASAVDLPPEQDSDSDLLSDATSRESPQDSPAQEKPNGVHAGTQDASTKDPVGQQRSVRPVLRAYASARDLGMSPRNGVEPMQRLSSSHDEEDSVADQNESNAESSPSRPRRHRHHSSAAILRTDTAPRPLHAKSSSHPDLRALLEDYTTRGPSHKTRVYGPSSGPVTPTSEDPPVIGMTKQAEAETTQVANDADDADEVVEVLGSRRKSRGRAPSASLSNKSSSPTT